MLRAVAVGNDSAYGDCSLPVAKYVLSCIVPLLFAILNLCHLDPLTNQ